MILVTLGTHHQQFERLIDALDAFPGADLVVQYGHSSRPRGVREGSAFYPMHELEALMLEADHVIAHGGVGSILLARRLGHQPIVVPRRYHHGEHVDDHQVELTKELERAGAVRAVWNVDDLDGTVAETPPRGPRRTCAEGPLHRAVRSALAG